MLVTSIFSFLHNVFQRYLPGGGLSLGLFGKGLKVYLCNFEFLSLFSDIFCSVAV